MPTYSSVCSACGKTYEYVSRIVDRGNTPRCCDKPTDKVLDAPRVSAMAWTGHKGFHVPDGVNGKGTWIEDGAAYHRYLKQHNKIPASEGVREAEIQKANRERADDHKLEAAVEKAVYTHLRA